MDQIGSTLDLIADKLNQFLHNIHFREKELVIVSNMLDHNGQVFEDAKDKMVIFLANIQHETIISTYNKNMPTSNNSYATVAPPLYINIYVLFYANYSDTNYRLGLGMISDTLAFFQQNPYFTRTNLPGLDPVIDKLTFNLENLDVSQVNDLLGLIGVRYLPSLYYKIRLIPYLSENFKEQTPGVQGLQDRGQPKTAGTVK